MFLKSPEEMTDAEIALSGQAAGLLMGHVFPAYCALCGSSEAAIERIKQMLDSCQEEEIVIADAEQLLDNMDQIDFCKERTFQVFSRLDRLE